MENIIYNILIVIALLVVIELLDLPDWIGRKLRGHESRKNLEDKVEELEKRLKALEEKKE